MSLVNTMMQPLISMYQARTLDKWEILFSRYGVWGAFQAQNSSPSSILTKRNRTSLENSWGNTVPIVVLQGDELTIGSTYSCSVADQENTSNEITPTFTPYAWGWTMYPAQYTLPGQALNYVQYQDDFTHKADEYLKALMTAVDTASRNILETNKNTYWTTNVANYYAVVGDAIQIPQSAKNDAFNQLSAVANEMDLYEEALAISSTSLKPLTTRLENQGTGNATNESFQFKLGAFTWTGSNRVTNGTNIQSTMYMVQPGAIAVFNRNAPDFRNKSDLGVLGQWNIMMLPRLGMEVGTFYKAECSGSPSATSYMRNTLQATVKESFGFNTEIGWLTPYNSSPTTKVTPIVKVEISNS